MSDVHRIDGLKINFERQTDEELETIRGNLLERHARLAGDIALLDEVIFERNAVMLDQALEYGRVEPNV